METEINITITGKVINEDGIVTDEHFLDNELIDVFTEIQGRRRVAFTELGSVHRLFHSEIEKGNIHNYKIKTSKGSIAAFSIDDDLHIEENPNIESVSHIIDKLNRDSVARYRYMGQSLYSLAYEYFTKRHDRNIVSYCSPQVYNILKDNINSPFLDFYKNSVQVAYDKNEQYTSILRSCGNFGWSLFNPTDEVKRYDSKSDIETCLYFVETSNSFPLKGNGQYFDGVVEKALKYELITKEDIKYYIKPSHILKQDRFYNFVSEIYDSFGCDAKYGINGFIGLLGCKTICKERTYFESDYDAVANDVVNNNENGSIQIRGIYKNGKSQYEGINLLNADDDELDETINSRSEEKPMLYNVLIKTEISKYENTLPIHRKIYDIANMEMYELYLDVKKLNPKAGLVGIKTDCLVFNKIKKDIELSDEIGGVKNVGYQKVTNIL